MRNLLLVVALLMASPVWAAESNKSGATSSGETVNIRFNPLLLLLGLNGEADFAVDPDWTIGPSLTYYHLKTPSNSSLYMSDFELNGYDVGVRANWFRDGVFQSGMYVGPSVHYANITVTGTDSSGVTRTGTASPILATAVVGYAWFWNTFNMMLGGGGTVPLGNSKVTITDSTGKNTDYPINLAGLALEFTLGWKF